MQLNNLCADTATDDARYNAMAAAKEAGATARQSRMDESDEESYVHPLLRLTSQPEEPALGQRAVAAPQQPLRRRHHTRVSSRSLSSSHVRTSNVGGSSLSSSHSRLEQTSLTSARIREPFLSQVYVTNLEQDNMQKTLANYRRWIVSKRASQDVDREAIPKLASKIRQHEHHASIIPRSLLKRHRTGHPEQSDNLAVPRRHISFPLTEESRHNTRLGRVKTKMRVPSGPSIQDPCYAGMVKPTHDLHGMIDARQRKTTISKNNMPEPSYPPPPMPHSRPTLVMPLPWQHVRPPYSPAVADDSPDLDRVESWLSNTRRHMHIPRSATPPSPVSEVFTDQSGSRHVSTAPSSPVEPQRAELEGDMPPMIVKRAKTLSAIQSGMTSSITDWKDLDGCTPDFVQSVKFLTIIGAIPDDGSEFNDTKSCIRDDAGLLSIGQLSDDARLLSEGIHVDEAANEVNDAEFKTFGPSQVFKNDLECKQFASHGYNNSCGELSDFIDLSYPQKHLTEVVPEHKATAFATIRTQFISKKLPKPHISRLLIPDYTPFYVSAPVDCTDHISKVLPPLPTENMAGDTGNRTTDSMSLYSNDEATKEQSLGREDRDYNDSATLPPDNHLRRNPYLKPLVRRRRNAMDLHAQGGESSQALHQDNSTIIENGNSNTTMYPPTPPARGRRPLVRMDFPKYTKSALTTIKMRLSSSTSSFGQSSWKISLGDSTDPIGEGEATAAIIDVPILLNKAFDSIDNDFDRLEFTSPSSPKATLFTLVKQRSSSHICAESESGDSYFTVREVHPGKNEEGIWIITLKISPEAKTIRWEARCNLSDTTYDHFCKELKITDEDNKEVGSILVTEEEFVTSSVSLPFPPYHRRLQTLTIL